MNGTVSSPQTQPGDPTPQVSGIRGEPHYRILHGEEELAVKPRRDTSPITRLYVRGMKTQA
jgi:hypothetical protein